jgi:hypothetical protein
VPEIDWEVVRLFQSHETDAELPDLIRRLNGASHDDLHRNAVLGLALAKAALIVANSRHQGSHL